MRGQGLVIRSEAEAHTTMLALSGRLDVAATPDARRDLHTLIDSGDTPIRLDLGACTVLDATGLGLLVELQRRALRRGRPLTTVAADARTRRLLRRVRLGRLLHALESDHLGLVSEPATA